MNTFLSDGNFSHSGAVSGRPCEYSCMRTASAISGVFSSFMYQEREILKGLSVPFIILTNIICKVNCSMSQRTVGIKTMLLFIQEIIPLQISLYLYLHSRYETVLGWNTSCSCFNPLSLRESNLRVYGRSREESQNSSNRMVGTDILYTV